MRRAGVVFVLALAMCTTAGGSDSAPMRPKSTFAPHKSSRVEFDQSGRHLTQQVKVGHSARYELVQRVKAGLAFYDRAGRIPMRDSYWAAEAAGHFYDVNPAVMYGIAAKESQLGRTACGFNAFGFASCGSNRWLDLPRNLCRWFHWPATCGDGQPDSVPHLRSWRESLWLMAWQIRSRYLNQGVRSVQGILDGGYCAGCPSWAGDVTRFMAPFGMGVGVSYPERRK